MNEIKSISLKDDSLLRKKKRLDLAINLLISVLGLSSLFIKIVLLDGVTAFRFFTVDGNLFTTVVSLVAVVVNVRGLREDGEGEGSRMYFWQLTAAVTEAVIFIVVMVGYLPVFPDDPVITPYNMFCLHVAIPVLSVLRFLFFEKPCGILKPFRLLVGTIPIGIYGVGVVSAIKLGLLPASLIPYSFLDFESNFLWYFVFALVVIPTFGFLWSWTFYRLNIRASLLWYRREDVERFQRARVLAFSSFDVVNSGILLLYCVLAALVLVFALRGMSRTTTGVQGELMKYIAFYVMDDHSNTLSNEPWRMEDGRLYKGDVLFGDGTEVNGRRLSFKKQEVLFESTVYVQSVYLSEELASQYDGMDFVAVCHSAGENGPVRRCGETLEREIAAAVMLSPERLVYETVQWENTDYFHACMVFGKDMWESGIGMIELYFPAAELTAQAKNAEYNNDLVMIAVIFIAFALLYVLTNKWIRVLERSVEFLKAIAGGRTPEEPIVLGKTALFSGLERQLNIIRDINKE